MARLSKEQVVGIVKNAPEGVTPEAVVKELVRQGHTLDGYGEPAKPQSFLERNARTISAVARPTLEMGGMVGGAALAGAGSLPLGPVAVPSAAVGGALGFAGGKSAADTLDRYMGIKAPIRTVPEAVKESAGNIAEGGMLEATGAAIPAAASALNPVAKKALGFMAEKFGGLAADTTALLEKNAPAVVKYARMGGEAAAEAAAAAAKTVKAHIDDYVDKAGDAYKQAVDALVAQNPAYNNLRVDLPRLAGKTIETMRQDFGFAETGTRRLPNLRIVDAAGRPIEAAQGAIERVGKPAGDNDLFNEFADQFKKQLTPTQAYLLQKDLSYAIRANAGKPISAALGQLKKAAVDAFDATIGGTPLQGINNGYRAAMTLAEDLSKVSNADNAVQVINSAFRNKGETRDALRTIAKLSPGVQAALDDMFAATAGKQVASWSRFLPNNGLAGAAMIEGVNAAKYGLGSVPYVAAAGAATSPRLYGEAFNVLSKSLPKVPQGGAAAALAALRARRKDEK